MNKYARTSQSETKESLANKIQSLCAVLGFKCKSEKKLLKMSHQRLVKKATALDQKFGLDLMGNQKYNE